MSRTGPVKISIPSYRRICDDQSRSYTVFCILVAVAGRRYTIEKRYTDFEELHKMLKSTFAAPPFPSKSVLKWSPKVLEHRRQTFETYLQVLTGEPKIPRSVLAFLEIGCDNEFNSTESLDCLDQPCGGIKVTQPMIAFHEEAFLHEQLRSGLPDIISTGAVQGLYSSHSSINDVSAVVQRLNSRQWIRSAVDLLRPYGLRTVVLAMHAKAK